MSTEVSAESLALEGCLAWAARRYPGYILEAVSCTVTGPDGLSVKVALDPAAYCLRRVSLPVVQPQARHSPDYCSCHWYGTLYTFSPLQAAVVKILWEAWEQGTPDVRGDYLLENAGSDRDVKRMDSLFQDSPAWNAMIQTVRKGAYRLVPAA